MKVFNFKNFSRPQLIFGVSVLILVFISLKLGREVINRHQISRQIADLEQQIQDIGRDNEEISRNLSSAQGDVQLEKEARLKLGLKREGETAVIILRNSSTELSVLPIKSNQEIIGNAIVDKNIGGESSNPARWWRHFMHN